MVVALPGGGPPDPMTGFKGQAEYSVDNKGRVTIPAKMRNMLDPDAKQTFTVTRGFERCIFLYPLNEWSQIENDIAGLSRYDRKARDYVRIILRWADEVALDGQGRVKLPTPLVEFAGVSDQALILGALDRLEVWDPAVFDEHMNQQTDDYETLAERVMGV